MMKSDPQRGSICRLQLSLRSEGRALVSRTGSLSKGSRTFPSTVSIREDGRRRALAGIPHAGFHEGLMAYGESKCLAFSVDGSMHSHIPRSPRPTCYVSESGLSGPGNSITNKIVLVFKPSITKKNRKQFKIKLEVQMKDRTGLLCVIKGESCWRDSERVCTLAWPRARGSAGTRLQPAKPPGAHTARDALGTQAEKWR